MSITIIMKIHNKKKSGYRYRQHGGSEPAAPVFYRLVKSVSTNQDVGMLRLVPVVTG